MTRLLAAELLKLRTLRSTWGFVLVALLFAALTAAGNIGGSSDERLDPRFQFGLALDTGFPGGILALLLGIILVTNEFRHGTIARTLLASPHRVRFVAVKLVAGCFVGVALMLGMLLVVAVTSAIWLSAIDVPLAVDELADGAWHAIVVAALAGLVGAALGAAVHSQVAALVGVLLWMFMLEPICWVILGLLDIGGVAEYLPTAAFGGTLDPNDDGLSWGVSIAVAVAWIAFATAVALVRTSRRDIT